MDGFRTGKGDKTMGKLTVKLVNAITKPGKYIDRDGLMLRVAPGGSKQWVWRGTVHGRRIDRGLGSARYVTLKEAREQAFQYRRASRAGKDPRTLRAAVAPTFAEALEAVIETRRPTWKGSTNEQQWRSSLARYAPELFDRTVDQILPRDVLGILRLIWNSKPATAERIRSRISLVMRWSITNGHRTDDPASKAVTAALPKHNGPRNHQPALPHAEVAAVLRRISTEGRFWIGIRLLVEYVVLTAARSGEARGATWGEIDLEARIWTVPAARMKSAREHRVPLSDAARDVLVQAEPLAGRDDLVFPSARGGQVDKSTPSRLFRELEIPATLHGFRSSFRDWCSDTAVPREVAEQALAHVVRGVEGAYARSDLLERRRPVMERWGAYCHGP